MFISALISKASDKWYVLILFFIIGMLYSLKAQDLDSHRWKDRVLLLYTDDLKNPEYLRQTRALQDGPGELEERSLVVYTLHENRYARGLPPVSWEKGSLKGFKAKDIETFRLVLIGLDGGVKLQESGFVDPVTLWRLIDTMPMRRAELKNKGTP
ncbi:MAG: DUF4174 domain-containing protein [Robiginitalea sp.]